MQNLLRFFTLSLILTSCEAKKEGFEVIVDDWPMTDLFKSGELIMWADRKNVVVNAPTTISQKCTPLYSGVGRIVLNMTGSQQIATIDSPFVDTLDTGIYKSFIVIKTKFVANQNFIASWKVRLLNPKEYYFSGVAYMDSLLINGKHYDVRSNEVMEFLPQLPINEYAVNFDKLVFKYP